MNADHTLARITAHLLSTLPYLALIQGVLLAWGLWQGGGAAWGQFGNWRFICIFVWHLTNVFSKTLPHNTTLRPNLTPAAPN